MLLRLLEKLTSMTFCQIQRLTNQRSMLILHEVRLFIGHLMVFFDGVPLDRSHFAAQGHPHFPAQPGRAFLGRLFRHNPSDTYDTSPSSSFDWARNLLKWRGRTDEGIKLHGRSQAVVEVPCAPGQRRNACARERRRPVKLPSKSTTPGSSQRFRPKIGETQIQPCSQPQAADSSLSTTPAVGDPTAAAASTMPSRRHAMIRHAGLWTRLWLFIGCLSPEYTDGDH